jgi:hypothetical protein
MRNIKKSPERYALLGENGGFLSHRMPKEEFNKKWSDFVKKNDLQKLTFMRTEK